MSEIRDWSSTLWPASYMGVAFFFERDDSEGGRRLEVHEFFDADDPQIEDLGRKPRLFSGTAYVASDTADIDALELELTFETQGPGTLVVPIMGPVSVHCESFRRRSDKDRLGFIAFNVRFVRDGISGSIISTPLLAQQVFDAADVLAGALAGGFPNALILSNPADYVIAAAIDEVQNVAVAIEQIRAANPVTATASAAVAECDSAIVAEAPSLIVYGNPANDADISAALAALVAASPDIDPAITDPTSALAAVVVANIRALGDGMTGNVDAGSGALLALAIAFDSLAPPPALSSNVAAASSNVAAIDGLVRVGALMAWCEALARQSYASRPDGVAARAAAAERLGQELQNWTGAAGFPIFAALQDLQGAIVSYLTQLIADLAPVVTVEVPQSMPALYWAWRLYQDPTRAVDLVLRNDVVHPSFMPTEFQALAPGFTAPATLPTAWPAP